MELLSPAGGWDSLKAAVENGADAVYIGARNFSARNLADNFDDLAAAASFAHAAGVRLYLALNTLVRDREIPAWLDTARTAVQAGIDAFIVQDLGCAMLLRELCPSFPLHASTQMTAHNMSNVRALQKLGFRRIVLARELSFSEICAIRENTETELEVFVHGALCACYSGQCLMSSLFGGRSANRGLCAQPCRLGYSANGKQGRLLSPRDLCLIDYIPRLAQAGIASAKIEGRMKPAQYVGTVTRIYRKALDGRPVTEKDKSDLLKVFSRRGFTDRPFAKSIPSVFPKSEAKERPALPAGHPFGTYVPLKKGKRKKPRKLAAQVLTAEQAKAVLPLADILYVPYSASWANDLPRDHAQVIGAHPLISHDGEQSNSRFNFDGELLTTLTDTEAACKISDASLHAMNGQTLKALRSLGYKRATVSVELNAAQIADLPDLLPTEAIVYGRLTLMTTSHCPMRCNDKKHCPTMAGKALLTDRMGKSFPILRVGPGCRVAILNSAPLYMADKLDSVSANVLRLIFTTESPKQCAGLVREYRQAMQGKPHTPPGEFTRGHFTRGVK
ncbi:peptidase U32 family protein [Christensenella intestinihominis]|uniref:peptidase U32 family protein n=1 Tax=Christensenella intestinihominis TaxID=1851429 RepID=UPI0008350880|nr:peptidase U32 family protein [Christensenella intestinihominis]